MKHIVLTDDIYGVEIEIFIEENIKKILKWCPVDIREDIKMWPDTVQGACIPRPNKIIIWMRFFSWDTFTHEAFHATCFVLKGAGLHLCDKSEEAFAYFIGWLSAEMAENLQKYVTKKTIKK